MGKVCDVIIINLHVMFWLPKWKKNLIDLLYFFFFQYESSDVQPYRFASLSMIFSVKYCSGAISYCFNTIFCILNAFFLCSSRAHTVVCST